MNAEHTEESEKEGGQGSGGVRENKKEEIYTVPAYEFKRLSRRPHRNVIVPVTGFIIESRGTNVEALHDMRSMKCTAGSTVVVDIPEQKQIRRKTTALRAKWTGRSKLFGENRVFRIPARCDDACRGELFSCTPCLGSCGL